jgi:flagellar basal body-associated protein FliL
MMIWIILGVVVVFMALAAVGIVVACGADPHVLCVSCSPIGAGISWRKPEPAEHCEICGYVEPA